MNRRDFFRAGFKKLREGAAEVVGNQLPELAKGFGALAGGDRPKPAAQRTVVRPPGALPEAEFLSTCERCRACVDICPEFCIIPSQPGMAAELGTPYLLPEEAPCTFCGDCVEACPTGALVRWEEDSEQIGRAVIEPMNCVITTGEACTACVDACPRSGQAIRFPDGPGLQLPVVDEPSCTGCGYCGQACPAPARAITIFPLA